MMTIETARRRAGSASRLGAGLAALGALALLGAAGRDAGAAVQDRDIEETRSALEKWYDARRLISKEKRDWALGKEVLASRIEIVEKDLESFRKRIDDARASVTDADRRREVLVAEKDALAAAAKGLEETVAALEAETLRLVERIPDPARERVRPLSQQIPTDPAETKLSLSLRYQNIVGVLNGLDKFNSEIGVFSEVRTLADGSTTEVTSLYVGLGQGYYVNLAGTVSGSGRATDTGWEWVEDDARAADVARAIAIFRNEQMADFVPLPVTIR